MNAATDAEVLKWLAENEWNDGINLLAEKQRPQQVKWGMHHEWIGEPCCFRSRA